MNNKIINVAHTLIDVSQIAAILNHSLIDQGLTANIPIILKGGNKLSIQIHKHMVPNGTTLNIYAMTIRDEIIDIWEDLSDSQILYLPRTFNRKEE